nr:EFR1 family ferrodoxin [Clostridiales bacterium]
MVFYFTATGNSLYVAKHLDTELISIPQEMNKTDRHYKADKIGIVCPLFELDLPDLIKDFIRSSTFDTEYFYIIVTYGMHHGGVAERTQEFLESIGKKADYINTIIMHDNAIIVFDM